MVIGILSPPPRSIVAHNDYRHPNSQPDLDPSKVWPGFRADYPTGVASPLHTAQLTAVLFTL
jgi:hypothetical protein